MSAPRLLVIGTRGFVGWNLARAAEKCFERVADDGVDITDAATVARCLDAGRPDAVVLLAAISDIDRCEREPALAERVNVAGAANVARACEARGIRFLFTSTGAVFDGAKTGYVEKDPVTPLSVYGRTKVAAERAVMVTLPSAAVVRLPLVLGFAANARANSLVNKLRDALAAGRTVRTPVNEYRNAIDVTALCRILLRMAAMPEIQGIFHAGSDRAQSRFEIARTLAGGMGYSPDLVEPESAPAAGRAPRGEHHFLIADKLAAACGIPVPRWDEVMERCLDATT